MQCPACVRWDPGGEGPLSTPVRKPNLVPWPSQIVHQRPGRRMASSRAEPNYGLVVKCWWHNIAIDHWHRASPNTVQFGHASKLENNAFVQMSIVGPHQNAVASP